MACRRWLLMAAVVSLTLLDVTSGQQCMGCEYTDTLTDCANLGLTLVPVCLPSSTTIIFLSINDISQLTAADFQHLPNVEHLDLALNQLETLPEDVFMYMPNIYFINLDSNKLIELPDNLFLGNPEVSFFSAADNMITKLNQHTFQPLTELSIVFLTDNLIRYIDYVDTFVNNTKLKHLEISRNELVTLHKEAFVSQHDMEIGLVGNNWHCDCILTNLTEAFKRQKIYFPVYYTSSCSTPADLYGKQWEFLDPLPCDT